MFFSYRFWVESGNHTKKSWFHYWFMSCCKHREVEKRKAIDKSSSLVFYGALSAVGHVSTPKLLSALIQNLVIMSFGI